MRSGCKEEQNGALFGPRYCRVRCWADRFFRFLSPLPHDSPSVSCAAGRGRVLLFHCVNKRETRRILKSHLKLIGARGLSSFTRINHPSSPLLSPHWSLFQPWALFFFFVQSFSSRTSITSLRAFLPLYLSLSLFLITRVQTLQELKVFISSVLQSPSCLCPL